MIGRIRYLTQAVFNMYAAFIGIMIAIKHDKPSLADLTYFVVHPRNTFNIGLAAYHSKKYLPAQEISPLDPEEWSMCWKRYMK